MSLLEELLPPWRRIRRHIQTGLLVLGIAFQGLGFGLWVAWTDWPLWKKALWTGAIGVGTTLLALLGAWWIYS